MKRFFNKVIFLFFILLGIGSAFAQKERKPISFLIGKERLYFDLDTSFIGAFIKDGKNNVLNLNTRLKEIGINPYSKGEIRAYNINYGGDLKSFSNGEELLRKNIGVSFLFRRIVGKDGPAIITEKFFLKLKNSKDESWLRNQGRKYKFLIEKIYLENTYLCSLEERNFIDVIELISFFQNNELIGVC